MPGMLHGNIAHLDCDCHGAALILDPQDIFLCELEVLLGPCLLTWTMQGDMAAVFQFEPAVPVILHVHDIYAA